MKIGSKNSFSGERRRRAELIRSGEGWWVIFLHKIDNILQYIIHDLYIVPYLYIDCYYMVLRNYLVIQISKIVYWIFSIKYFLLLGFFILLHEWDHIFFGVIRVIFAQNKFWSGAIDDI